MVSKVCQSDDSEQNHSLCHLLQPSAGPEQGSVLWELGVVLKVMVLVCREHWRQSHPDGDTHIHRLARMVKGATVRSRSFWKALSCLEGFAFYQKQFQGKANSFW